MFFAEILTAANALLLLTLFVRGFSVGLAAEYPVFFGYVAFELVYAVSAELILLMWGVRSEAYAYYYYGNSILVPLLQLWILGDLLYRVFENSLEAGKVNRYLWILTAVLSLPVVIAMVFLESDVFHRYQAATLAVQMMLCLLIHVYLLERRDIEMGRNLRGVLLGMSLLVGFQLFNFFYQLLQKTPFEVFSFLVPAIYLGALMIFIYSMWVFVPIQQIPIRREFDLQLQQGLRSILRILLPR